MPAITFPEPPPAFSCGICRSASYVNKLGTDQCRACPAFKDKHYFPNPIGDVNCDVIFVGDAPLVPRLTVLYQDREPEHYAFNDTAGKVVTSAVMSLRKDPRYAGLKCRYTYAVRCASDNVTKKMIDACRVGHLMGEVSATIQARIAAGNKGPLVIVAHGASALRALGIAIASETEAAGLTFDITIADTPVKVVASRGMKSIVGAPGKFSSLVADIERAFQLAIDRPVTRVERSVLEKHYVYPRTIDEVRKLCDDIIAYAPSGSDPSEWMISVDTETNTLFPHRDGLQLTIVSFSWGAGLACAIPLWHKDTPYDPAQAFEHVKRVLACNKKKVFHNAKYDLKVFWKMGTDVNRLYWDVMLAEHALEEDKKGQYGLKYLVKQFLPTYAGYEDQLHEKLAAAQGERQLDNVRITKKNETIERTIPAVAQKALDDIGLKPTFQAAALKKRIDAIRQRQAEYPTQLDIAIANLQIPLPAKGKVYQKRMNELKAQSAGILDRSSLIAPSDLEQLFLDDLGLVLSALDEGELPLPPTDADTRFVAAAEIVFYYANDFKGKVAKEQTKQQHKESGGFEKIPLWETKKIENPDGTITSETDYSRGLQLFYAAVDADVTRQLAVQQYNRMVDEDVAYRKLKDEVRQMVMMTRSRGSETYEVRDLCPTPNPVVNLVKNYYVPRVRALGDMEYRGIKVDHDYIKTSMTKLENVAREETEKLYKMAGTEFKIGDGRKIARFLFDTGEGYIPSNPEKAAKLAAQYPDRVKYANGRLMYQGISYTEKGAIQTTDKVLRTLSQTYGCEFADTVMLLRKATKAKDTFLLNALELSADGYIHTNYNLNGTATGRLSSNDINMQNIPKGEMGGIPKTDPRYLQLTKAQCAGVKCKSMFIPDDETQLFINCDAKGAEVAVFAAYSMDAKLIAALREGMDAHSFFSSQILNPEKVAHGLSGADRKRMLDKVGIDDDHAWSYEDFAKRNTLKKSLVASEREYGERLDKHRDNVKRVVFGILFGAGPKKIAEIVGIEAELAKAIIDLLFKMFPTIPAFIEQTKWELRTFGMVETYFGRKRRFSMKNAPKEMLSRAERQAVNFKIQASNSDIILWCLTEMAPVIERDMGGRMLLTVHDSLGFQIKKQYVTQLKDLVAEYGTRRVAKLCPWFPVDFKWDIDVGPSYGVTDKIDDYLANHQADIESFSQALVEEEILHDLRLEGEGELPF